MEVIVFGTEGCAGCVTVKNLLKQHNIVFTELDVMNVDHMETAQKYGVRGIPTVVMPMQNSFGYVTGSDTKSIDLIKDMVGIN